VQLFNTLCDESVKERKHLGDSIRKSKVWEHLLQDLKAAHDERNLTAKHQVVLFRLGGFKDRTWTLLRAALKQAFGIRLNGCTTLREVGNSVRVQLVKCLYP
jgi:hypothetical protein